MTFRSCFFFLPLSIRTNSSIQKETTKQEWVILLTQTLYLHQWWYPLLVTVVLGLVWYSSGILNRIKSDWCCFSQQWYWPGRGLRWTAAGPKTSSTSSVDGWCFESLLVWIKYTNISLYVCVYTLHKYSSKAVYMGGGVSLLPSFECKSYIRS